MKTEEIEKEQIGIASMIINHNKWIIKLLTIVIVIQTIIIGGVAYGVLNFATGYTFESDVQVTSDGTAAAIYQNGKGNTINGECESKEDDETKR